MKTPIITTKLNSPRLRAKIVPRLRLVEGLEEDFLQEDVFGRKLTLVSAPAGYGKTTLVVDWLARHRSRTGWVSLEEADNDPRRFITYLIAALEQINGCIGEAPNAILQYSQQAPDDVLIAALLNEISSVDQPIILVLDDYHVIHTPVIHEQLAFLIDHQPTNLHLVITTREDPLLPVSRLRARGQILEIQQSDLRFTADETSTFLNKVMGLDISPVEAAELEYRTEGWIAGLQLGSIVHAAPWRSIRLHSGVHWFKSLHSGLPDRRSL